MELYVVRYKKNAYEEARDMFVEAEREDVIAYAMRLAERDNTAVFVFEPEHEIHSLKSCRAFEGVVCLPPIVGLGVVDYPMPVDEFEPRNIDGTIFIHYVNDSGACVETLRGFVPISAIDICARN